MLTAAQQAARKGKLTASRIACLMRGDAAAIMQLYLEMIGEAEPEDLSKNWPVFRGERMEPALLDWFQLENNCVLAQRGKVRLHPKLAWAAATLDGWYVEAKCPIEAKDVGGNEPLEVIIDRYQPQMQWQMEVTSAEQCALTVSLGARKPITEFIPRDPDYAMEMILRGEMFMRHVEARTPPVALPPVPPPADWSKVYDLTGSNEWAAAAHDWRSTRAQATINKDMEKVLKAMVPEDAKKCFGHDVQITRDRAGRLSLREAQP